MENSEKLEFDMLLKIVHFYHYKGKRRLSNFSLSEDYASHLLMNELYRLPRNGFLNKLLVRVGVRPFKFNIEYVEATPEYEIFDKYHKRTAYLKWESNPGKRPLRRNSIKPDFAIESDKNLIFIEFKNFYKEGSFQREQIPRQYFAGLKYAKKREFYLILVSNSKSSLVHVSGLGNVDPYETIKEHKDKYLKANPLITSSFHKQFSKKRIIHLYWGEFLHKIHQQIGNCKSHTSDSSLKGHYDMIQRRIDKFSKLRKLEYNQVRNINK